MHVAGLRVGRGQDSGGVSSSEHKRTRRCAAGAGLKLHCTHPCTQIAEPQRRMCPRPPLGLDCTGCQTMHPRRLARRPVPVAPCAAFSTCALCSVTDLQCHENRRLPVYICACPAPSSPRAPVVVGAAHNSTPNPLTQLTSYTPRGCRSLLTCESAVSFFCPNLCI